MYFKDNYGDILYFLIVIKPHKRPKLTMNWCLCFQSLIQSPMVVQRILKTHQCQPQTKLESQLPLPHCVDAGITVPQWEGQRSALWYQRQDVGAWDQQRPLDLLLGLWCAGCVWENPGCCRWLWPAAPLREGPPSDDRGARVSEGGNRQMIGRL